MDLDTAKTIHSNNSVTLYVANGLTDKLHNNTQRKTRFCRILELVQIIIIMMKQT